MGVLDTAVGNDVGKLSRRPEHGWMGLGKPEARAGMIHLLFRNRPKRARAAMMWTSRVSAMMPRRVCQGTSGDLSGQDRAAFVLLNLLECQEQIRAYLG